MRQQKLIRRTHVKLLTSQKLQNGSEERKNDVIRVQ